MTRFERKFRTDLNLKSHLPGKHGLNELMDDAIKQLWRINDGEFDYIAENISDDDIHLFVIGEKSTISELKRGIRLVNEMVEKYQNKLREDREEKLTKLL